MECQTKEYINESGEWVMKPKHKFDTLDDAIKAAKIENSKPERIHKVVAYKCNTCFKYHIGRNGKEISNKERLKLQKAGRKPKPLTFQEKLANVKIVGFIDLTKIKY
jgi:hypothetical protein